MLCVCVCGIFCQDKLSFALERVELQTEEATLFQRQTNDKILLIKVWKVFCVVCECFVVWEVFVLGPPLTEPEILVTKTSFCILPPLGVSQMRMMHECP